MPFINARIGKRLTSEQKVQVADMIAANVSILPGKTIDNTMIQITDDCDMFMGGEQRALMFLDMRVSKASPFDAKDKFVVALSAGFDALLGIPAGNQYYNIIEMPEWGARGHMRP